MHSKPPYLVQAFKATFHNLGVQSHIPQLGVQSHFFQFRRLEPLLQFQAFRATIFINLQIHFLHRHLEPQAFKVISPIGVQSHFSSSGVQSHFYTFRRSKPLVSQAFKSIPPKRIQSYKPLKPFLSQAFRAITFFYQAFRAISVQSHYLKQAFGVIVLGIQSHHFHRRSKPHLPILGVQSHLFQFRYSEPSFSLGIQSHFSNLGIYSQPRSITCLELLSSVRHSDPFPQFRRSKLP